MGALTCRSVVCWNECECRRGRRSVSCVTWVCTLEARSTWEALRNCRQADRRGEGFRDRGTLKREGWARGVFQNCCTDRGRQGERQRVWTREGAKGMGIRDPLMGAAPCLHHTYPASSITCTVPPSSPIPCLPPTYNLPAPTCALPPPITSLCLPLTKAMPPHRSPGCLRPASPSPLTQHPAPPYQDACGCLFNIPSPGAVTPREKHPPCGEARRRRRLDEG